MQCPDCGKTGEMSRYSNPEVKDPNVLWSCKKCGWVGKEREIKEEETIHAQRFLAMCEESLDPEAFEMLEEHIIPTLEKTRRIILCKEDYK